METNQLLQLATLALEGSVVLFLLLDFYKNRNGKQVKLFQKFQVSSLEEWLQSLDEILRINWKCDSTISHASNFEKLELIRKEGENLVLKIERNELLAVKSFWKSKITKLIFDSVQAIKTLMENRNEGNLEMKKTILLQDLVNLTEKLKPESQISFTCLSSSVQEIISLTPSELPSIGTFESLLDEQSKILNWSKFKMEILLSINRTGRNSDYQKASWYLRSSCLEIHKHFQTLTEESFCHLYSHTFCIFNDEQKVLELFRLHKQGRSLLAFLIGVAELDRAIGDVMYILTNGKQLIPKKLRFILITKEIQSVLQPDMIFLISSFIGPLDSLNLRNLTWHGFLRPSEFHESFTSFLLILILSLTPLVPILKDKNKRRARDNLINFESIWKQTPLEHLLNTISINDVTFLFQTNYFILPEYSGYFLEAWKDFIKGNYTNSLTLLFPQIEHCLRRIFVCINNVSDYLWTAETDILYSTLDILLAENIPETPTPNLIYEELGCELMNLLLDIFTWFEGPKVRDLLAHGSVEPNTIGPNMTQHVWALVILLCIKYSLDPSLYSKFSPLMDFLSSYQSKFHPKNFLRREMLECHKLWLEMTQLTEYSFTEEGFNFQAGKEFILKVKTNLENKFKNEFGIPPLFSIQIDQIEFWIEQPLNTIKCLPVEFTKITTMRLLVSTMKELIKSIIEYFKKIESSIKARKAPSGHRKNFAQFNSFRNYFEICFGVFMIGIDYLLHLSSMIECETSATNNSTLETIILCNKFIGHTLASVHPNHYWKKVGQSLAIFFGDMSQPTTELSLKERANFIDVFQNLKN